MASPGRNKEKLIPKGKEGKEGREKEGFQVLEGIPEIQESIEGTLELRGGKVSEEISEDKKKAPSSKGGKAITFDEREALRAKLLASLPSEAVMRKQILTVLQKKERVLMREQRRLVRLAYRAAYQLNTVVARLREIRRYFAMIAHATFDIVKHLWLKIVHGLD